MTSFTQFFLIFSLALLVSGAPEKSRYKEEKVKTTTEYEPSNLQIQVNSPNGAGFVHAEIPIEARALGARLHGGKSQPTIEDDVLVPFDDPNFE